MQSITSSVDLKNAIQLLEVEQDLQAQLLKDQFHLTVENLKPANLLKHALHDISSTPTLIDNVFGTAVGIASGLLTNRIFVGGSANLVRRLLGSVLQFGVSNTVAQHPDTIKSFGQMILHYLLNRREKNTTRL